MSLNDSLNFHIMLKAVSENSCRNKIFGNSKNFLKNLSLTYFFQTEPNRIVKLVQFV